MRGKGELELGRRNRAGHESASPDGVRLFAGSSRIDGHDAPDGRIASLGRMTGPVRRVYSQAATIPPRPPLAMPWGYCREKEEGWKRQEVSVRRLSDITAILSSSTASSYIPRHR